MNTISVGECLKFGWESFKKRALFLVGLTLIIIAVSMASSYIFGNFSNGILAFIGFLASLSVSILLDMGVTAFVLKYHDNVDAPKYSDLWHPQPFLYYAGATVLSALMVMIGLVLLVVPGIIFALSLMFVKFVVIERGLAPIEAMKESARIAKGHRWELLILLLAIIAINVIGAIPFGLGLLVTIPVSALAVAHKYRSLVHGAGEMTPATAKVA